jgi:hypothetical protein
MPSSQEKIAKIKVLAERGATEGERAAAREALRRIEEAAPGVTGPDPASDEWFSGGAYPRVSGRPTRKPRPDPGPGVAGISEDEVNRIVDEAFSSFSFEQSTAEHHHGRVWFDRS